MAFPPIPPSLKPIAHFMKAATEHDERDVVVAYWCRLYALQSALKLSSKQREETELLVAIMGWLETSKSAHHDNEAITNEIVAQAHLENYALKLFTYADQNDRAANFNKNVVKAYYTAGVVYDVLLTFGELSEEATDKRKYAKYKAAYIHNCLKNGETPVPGPPGESDENNENSSDADATPENNNQFVAPAPEPGPAPQPFNEIPSPSNDGDKPLINIPDDPQPFFQITADKLPSPPVDPNEENPGGFQPYNPNEAPAAIVPKYEPPPANVQLTPDQMAKAQKYCKYAGSALNFDDVKSAIDNLEKALHLLSTGKEK